MVDPLTLLAFVPAALALNLTPGADMMFCLGQGMRFGPRASVAASAGVALGGMVHVTLAGLGLGAVVAALPWAFDVIRWIGVGYLLWLAVQTWRSSGAAANPVPAPKSAFRSGLIVNLTNPKVILFVLAFVPQFVVPEAGPVQQRYFRGPRRTPCSIGADMSRIDETIDFIPVRIAVLTVSDTRGLAEDRSGDVLVARIAEAGHFLAARSIIRDGRGEIADQLRDWCADPEIDVVISTGGTGLTGRDVTVEAHRDVYEKEIDAFGTVFTIVSMQKIGTSAVQSRATAGVAQGTYLFALPGSPGACKDAWDEILIKQLDYRHKPCNFVEIMPRLDEHQRRK